jgi:hypothetical protein
MVVFYARYTYRGLQVFAEGYGLSLDDAIDAKMGINRARQWNLDGTGHGYHVRDKAATP